MTYLIFAVSIVCLLFWPAVAALMKVTGLAGDWEQAHWWGAAACGSLWLVTVVDLVVVVLALITTVTPRLRPMHCGSNCWPKLTRMVLVIKN